MSISGRFEMLALMQTMHAVGLMPTGIYEAERKRLVELLIHEGWMVSPLDPGEWTDAAGNLHQIDFSRFAKPIEEREDRDVQEGIFDWRAVISDFLKAALPVAGGNEIREEIIRLGVEATGDERLSTSFLNRSIRRAQTDISDERSETRKEIDALRSDLHELRQEIARAGISLRAPSTPSATQNPSSNGAQIEALQREIASCHWSAGDAEARGDGKGAAYWRGQAEKIESKLRALGA